MRGREWAQWANWREIARLLRDAERLLCGGSLMGCRRCAGSDVYMLGHGPSDLVALLGIVRSEVAEGALVCVANAEKPALFD